MLGVQCHLATLVVAVHGGFESIRGNGFHSARRAIEDRRERLSFGDCHRAQQVVLIFFGFRLPAGFQFDSEAGWPTDSYSDANEIGGSKRLGD
jgi:hypothetical protein